MYVRRVCAMKRKRKGERVLVCVCVCVCVCLCVIKKKQECERLEYSESQRESLPSCINVINW